jgi:hypothetical protein
LTPLLRLSPMIRSMASATSWSIVCGDARVVLARHPPVGVARELIGLDQRGVGQVSEDLVVWMMRRTSIRSGSVSR